MINKLKKITKKTPWLFKISVNLYICLRKIQYYILMLLFRQIENKAVFSSFKGKSYSCNPRAISEELRKLRPDIKIVWIFSNPEEKKGIVPSYVKCVKANSFKAFYEMVTAKFWIDNFQKPRTLKKKDGQIYIQTWHGDNPFKRILNDKLNEHNKTENLCETDNCDLMIVGSVFGEEKMRSAFGYDGNFLKYGMPRNDILIHPDENKASLVKSKLGLPMDYKIILFAPTFRLKKSTAYEFQHVEDIELHEVISTLEKKTNDRWCCLTRAHSAVRGLSGISTSNKIFDVTNYEDMADLLLITDLLITDYSSSAPDFALLNRPVILFQSDIQEYLKSDRTFYFDMKETPYLIAHNQFEIIDILNNLNWSTISQNCRDIRNFYGELETGEASKKVVEYMIGKL